MSNRFEAIGSFVYEKGNRIGVTLDEASVELARKLNAYQMRVERLKAEVDRLTNLQSGADRLKAEVERLRASSFVTAVPVEQYERVVKAGDAMAKRTEFFQKRWDADELCQEVEAWHTAKEGKQP